MLIALGTTLLDREAFDTLVDVVSLLDGVDVLAAVAPGVDHPMTDRRENVRVVGFVPMASLLTVGFSVVVAAGGAGTVLAALGQGIPMVIWPEGAEKPLNAERVATAGAGVLARLSRLAVLSRGRPAALIERVGRPGDPAVSES